MKRSITDRIARIEQLNKEIEKIRASCKHLLVNKTFKSSTGNFAPSYDYYVTSFECLNCGHRWCEEGSK